jgi:hypothetical protein
MFILVNGATTSAAILDTPDSAQHARAAARALLDAASTEDTPRPVGRG